MADQWVLLPDENQEPDEVYQRQQADAPEPFKAPVVSLIRSRPDLSA